TAEDERARKSRKASSMAPVGTSRIVDATARSLWSSSSDSSLTIGAAMASSTDGRNRTAFSGPVSTGGYGATWVPDRQAPCSRLRGRQIVAGAQPGTQDEGGRRRVARSSFQRGRSYVDRLERPRGDHR